MPWNVDTTKILNLSNSTFSKPISDGYDKHISEKLSEITDEIQNTDIMPFIYFAVGTANQGINGTNPSNDNGQNVTQSNILRQQYPKEFINEMIEKGYTCFVINIDDFVEEEFEESAKLKRIFINGAFPLEGTVQDQGTKNPETITATVKLFKSATGKNGKVLFLNCVEDENGSSIFKGMNNVLKGLKPESGVTYASSYLQNSTYYNLFRIANKKINLYFKNENVLNLTFDEVFGPIN